MIIEIEPNFAYEMIEEMKIYIPIYLSQEVENYVDNKIFEVLNEL